MKATLTGTAREERAGGVAVDAAGNVYQALAAGGSVAGQPYVGDKDLVLVKDSPTGTRLWTRELGTARLERAYGVAIDPAGDVVVTGYTNGDLDGGHAAQHDRRRVRRQVRSRRQPEVAAPVRRPGRGRPRLRDRDGRDREHLRHRLHPRQPRRDEPRRQGRLPRQARPERARSSGCSSSGAPARTRRGASPRPATASGVGGMTSGALGTPAGALDGWVARYDAAGNACLADRSSARPATRRSGG